MTGARPAAVLFDMDGTLLDSEKLWTIAMADYAAYRGGGLSEATRGALLGSNLIECVRFLLADCELPVTPADVASACDWVERRAAELFREGLPWRPGAAELLESVRASGTRAALVTSTFRSLTEIALWTLGRDVFDAVVCGDEVNGQNKPAPEPYLRACHLLDVDVRDCVAIEDSPTGMASAAGAGCFVVGVPCEVPLEPAPRRVIYDSLVELDAATLAGLITDSASGSAVPGDAAGCEDRWS